jgi:hypothetical protein
MKLLLLGMANTGKSTYLAALIHLLTAGRATTSLTLAGLSSFEAHAVALEDRWLACEPLDRTRKRSRGEGGFRIIPATGGGEVELAIPDLSGEHFRQIAARGMAAPGLFDALSNADGLMLFTNADRAPDDRLIFDEASEAADLEDAFAEELGEKPAPPEPDPEPVFNPDEMPEEVVVVELLQILNRRPSVRRKRSIAVVVSAWDVVTDSETPAEWLRRKRPMLWQFLEYNPDLWDFQAWGVSAQGGDYRLETERLRQLTDPADRIRIEGNGASRQDLSAPISWLITASTPAP